MITYHILLMLCINELYLVFLLVQIVQQALDSARCGRTCLIIAHRLSTVQNADVIYVLNGGNIVEHGSHSDLLAMNGIYARLYNSQKATQ